MTVPYSAGVNPPDFAAPPGACDCHMHFFHAEYPTAKTATLVHPPALPEDYRQLQQRLGLSRHVIVHPSAYGTDNRLLLDMLRSCGHAARGVAVVDTSVSDNELKVLDKAGVAGIRFNLVQAEATTFDMLLPLAERIQSLGWHIQLHAKPRDLLDHVDLIDRLPVHLVLDHMARINSDGDATHALQRQVLSWLQRGRVTMKLSGAYLASVSPTGAFHDLDEFVKLAVAQAPTQLIWGSDWPHVTEAEKPDDAHLLNLLSRWVTDPSTREQILVKNPQSIYKF
jgi:D-galactarolactone isomerase